MAGLLGQRRARLHLLFLLVLVGSLGLIVWGAWHGGEMIYRHGVGVEIVKAGESVDVRADLKDMTGQEKLQYFAPPLQLHVIFAGIAVALGMAALGLSLRSTASQSAHPRSELERDDFGAALAGEKRGRARRRSPRCRRRRECGPGDAPRPAARFWLLTSLAAIAAALCGIWTVGIWDPSDFWEHVSATDPDGPEITRLMAHFVAGSAIIVLPLILALVWRVHASAVHAGRAGAGAGRDGGGAGLVRQPAAFRFRTPARSRGFNTSVDTAAPASEPGSGPGTAPTTDSARRVIRGVGDGGEQAEPQQVAEALAPAHPIPRR